MTPVADSAPATVPGRRRTWRQDPEGRKRRILDAAAERFAWDGYGPTRVADIARAADVAEGTVYHLFDSKRGLLAAVGAEYGAGLAEAAFGGVGADVQPDDVEGIVRRMFGYVRDRGALLAVFLLTGDAQVSGIAQAANRETMVAAVEAALSGWMNAGLIPRVDAHIAAQLQFGLVEHALRACYLFDNAADEEAYIAEVVRSLRAMLRAAWPVS